MATLESKLQSRLDYLLKYENDNYWLNINLKNEISDKLYDYQYLHLINLITALRNNNVIFDGSDTGTGKTYTAVALCKQLDLIPFIIAPKSIMPSWKKVCREFNVRPLAIVNYETIKLGKFYEDDQRADCKFIDVIESTSATPATQTDNCIFKWRLPRKAIIIFDEAHKCSNIKTQNGQLLYQSKNQAKILLLSATLADSPKLFHIFGYMFDFYKNIKLASNWIKSIIKEDGMNLNTSSSSISKCIFPKKGSCMRISELGDKFPLNQVHADCYYVKENIRQKLILHYDQEKGNILTEISKMRIEVEKLKLEVFEELASDYIENGFHVAIFLNFNDNINTLAKKLNTTCIVNGLLDENRISENIENFQNNQEKIIIVNSAMALGFGLHDLHGIPRVSLISPTNFSGRELVQILGRIWRAGQKTPSLQRIIYIADTYEEEICGTMNQKIKTIDKFKE